MAERWRIPGHPALVEGLIKRIQTGTVTIGAGSLTQSFSFLAVDIANSVLLKCGSTHTTAGSTTLPISLAGISGFTSATSASVDRQTQNGLDTVTVQWFIVEFWPGVVRSIQQGVSPAFVSDPVTTTISAVGPKYWLLDNGFNGDPGAMTLTNPTTISFDNALIGNWQGFAIIDFN